MQLDPASERTVTVQYATADGPPRPARDYTAVTGRLTFRAGATTATIEVSILDDGTGEETETFTVTLSNATGATLSDAVATAASRTMTIQPPRTP